MATVIHARPVRPEADAERFQSLLADLRGAVDAVEAHATQSPRAARRHIYRLQTIASSARELADSIGAAREISE